MKKLFAALVVAATLGLLGVAQPAQAASGGACSNNAFCLYQWADFGAQVANDRWQTSFNNINNHANRCINIPPATWANGTGVADNSGSMAWNGSAEWADWSIAYFNWTNCQTGGGWGETGYLSGGGNLYNLSAYVYPSKPTISLYHTITSIQINYKP
jgi:hypothetical protein